jgi:cytochrome c553
MTPKFCAGLAVALALMAPPCASAENAAGRAIVLKGVPGAAACASCHGRLGAGDPRKGIPRLAGQERVYMAKELRSFRANQRKNADMSKEAAVLTDQAIEDVVDYLSGLPAPAPRPLKALTGPQKPPASGSMRELAVRMSPADSELMAAYVAAMKP